MPRKMQNLFWFLLENVPSFLTVAFAAYVLVQSQRASLQVMEVLLWLLGITGLLATSELVARFRTLNRIQQLSQETLEVVKANRPVPSAEIFFASESVSFPGELTEFTEIFVSGINLRRLATSCFGLFEHRLVEGAKLRFLLVDPGSKAVPIIAQRNYIYRDPKELKAVIQSTLDTLSRLGSSQPVKGSLEIRVLEYVPSYGLKLLDPNAPTGLIIVDLYPYQVPPDIYPSFSLRPKLDGKWFEFFRDQFDVMWNAAKPIHKIPP